MYTVEVFRMSTENWPEFLNDRLVHEVNSAGKFIYVNDFQRKKYCVGKRYNLFNLLQSRRLRLSFLWWSYIIEQSNRVQYTRILTPFKMGKKSVKNEEH